MKNKKRFVPWLIAAVIIAAFAVIGKKLYDLMFGGSLAVTTEDLKNGIIACSPAIIFIVVVPVSYTHLRAHRDVEESRMPSSA